MDYLQIEAAAKAAGFPHTGPLDPATIQLKPQVRQMCQACGMYDKRWSCPPGCGTLEECAQRIATFRQGLLVQTVGQLEDEFDGEGMLETENLHRENFRKFLKLLPEGETVLPLGAGSCNLCRECTYPEAPCRFPERMISSMEANGMVVLEVCKANHMPYYHGANTIAYTSCLLFDPL